MNSEEIKQQITMYEVLGRYGLSVGRSGMICCPFHGERHPSMKIYKGQMGYLRDSEYLM